MNDDLGDLFDGAEEIAKRLERGQRYGLTKMTFSSLAQACIAARTYSGVEPSTIKCLPDNQPGAIVELFGKQSVFTVTVTVHAPEPARPAITLDGLSLEAKPDQEPARLFTGEDNFRGWACLVNTILHTDGLSNGYRWSTQEEIDYWSNFRPPSSRPRPLTPFIDPAERREGGASEFA
jgi:hypothetical protein